MSKLRQGDVYIFNDTSGGNIQVINGEPEMDGGFESAVFITLFGNNGSSFWMNEYLTEDEKIKSEFMGFVEAAPITLTNINRAKELARSDLQWFINVGIADTIEIEIDAETRNRIDMDVIMLEDSVVIFKNTYQVNWGYQENDPAGGRLI
jgi:phage gp46-like protein